MTTRSDILDAYMTARTDKPVGHDDVFPPTSTDLAIDWLRYLTGRPEIEVPGAPLAWGTATADKLNPSLDALNAYARFYPARSKSHRTLLNPPQQGDILVFRTPTLPTPATVGVYVDHDDASYLLFTQDDAAENPKAQLVSFDTATHLLLGWWRIDAKFIHAAHGFTHEVAA